MFLHWLPWKNSRSISTRAAPSVARHKGLLAERGIDAHIVEYLKAAPTVPELRALMVQLGITDPRPMMRAGEDVYDSLGLADQSGDALLEAIAANPILLERPIVVRTGAPS
jgi:arsenate reductase